MHRFLIPLFAASTLLFGAQPDAHPKKTCCSAKCCKPDRNCDRHCDKACEKAGCTTCCDKTTKLHPAPTEHPKP
ncbi:MAG TPA: hypothetical protein VK188_14590 [Holophaga sp.]|nr:hypothetical protein [Holophaga sp.]